MALSDLEAGLLGGGGGFLINRALQGNKQGYAALPFDNGANRSIETSRIADEFHRAVGRAPSQDEIDMYGKYIKTGDLEYGDIGQILRGMPEAGESRLESYADKFGQRVGAADQAYLGSALDQIAAKTNSQFSSLGRPVTSAMGAQVFGQGGQIAQGLAQRRQSALSEFYGRGLSNLQGLYEDQGSRALGRAYNLTDSRTAFNRGLMGYQTQRSDASTDLYNENLRRRREALWQIPLSVAGGAAGASMGGPAGAQIGAQAGAKAGSLFSSY